MAKKIGNLAVIVSSNTAGLQKGLGAGARMVKGFKSSVSSTAASIGTAVAGVTVAAAAVGGAAFGLKTIADGIDKTAKTADALGVTTEALIGLRHAADLSGLGAEEFDGALQTMTKNVGLAAMGSGKAKAALEGLGFNLKALAQTSPENQLKAIANAMETVQNPTEKVALATKIFGDAGVSMINVLKGGATALEATQAEAAQLNLTFSRFQAAGVEILNDDLTRTWDVIKGLGQTLVIELAPYIDAGVKSFVDWAKAGNGFGDKVTVAVGWVVQAVTFLSDTIDIVKIAWYGMKAIGSLALLGLLAPIGLVIKGITKLIELAADYLPQSLVDAGAEAQAFADGFGQGLVDNVDEAKNAIEGILTGKGTGEKLKDFLANARKEFDATAKGIADQAPKAQPFTKALETQLHTSENLTDELGQQADKLQEIKDVSFGENNLIVAGSAQSQQLQAKTITDQLAKVIQKQIDMQKEANKALKNIDKNTAQSSDETVVDF